MLVAILYLYQTNTFILNSTILQDIPNNAIIYTLSNIDDKTYKIANVYFNFIADNTSEKYDYFSFTNSINGINCKLVDDIYKCTFDSAITSNLTSIAG